MTAKRNTIDMSTGALPGKIFRFALPLALTYILQLAFHAADMVVIGRWGSPDSLAAIGATHAILGLLLNIMTGLSTGANVLAAQYYGAKDSKKMTRMVHTTIAAGIIGGIAVAVLGILCIIELQDTENECIIQARNSPKKSFLFRRYKEVFLEVRLIKRRF